jgi:Big-like domain-containing protein/VCBS repeat protein
MALRSLRRTRSAERSRRDSIAKSTALRCEPLEDRVTPVLFNVQSSMTFSGLNNNGCVASADFNKDGRMDAVMTNFGTDYSAGAGSTITVLYGNSGGGFTRVTLNTGGTNVAFASVGDIDGDTWPDLVVANANGQNTGSVSIFKNTSGNLAPPPSPAPATIATASNNASWVGLSDVTGDNILDIVVGSFGREVNNDIQGNNITIFEGFATQGQGNFTFNASPITLSPEIQFCPTALAVADFDGDGIRDIAAVSPGIPPDFGQPYPNGVVYLFRGTGSGGFSSPNQLETGGVLPVNIQAADVNGDNKPDLIVANAGDPNSNPEWSADGVGVLLNVSTSGNVNFGLPNALTANTLGTFAVAVADFDLDGDKDIAAVNYGSQLGSPAAFVSVYLGNGAGVFTPANPAMYDTQTSLPGGQYLAVGDYDANGTPDLIVAHANNKVGLLLNTSVAQVVTTTTVQSSLNPSSFNDSVTFTATVSGNPGPVTGGTVTFFDNGVAMGNAVTLTNQQAAFTTSTLSVGNHSITATYSGASGFAGSTSNPLSQVVTSGAAQSFSFTGVPVNTTAGVGFNFTVSARDQFNNVANGYRGTVHFTSSDLQAVLPADYTFTAADNGSHTFTVMFKTAGVQSLTATDTVTSSITGTANTTVNPTSASLFTIAGFPSNTTAGAAHDFTVTAMDAFGNVAAGYRGTVHFTSSDLQASLPANYTFTAADNGVHTFTASLKTVGTQNLVATDTVSSSVTGTQAGITVNAASASTLVLSGLPASLTAGTLQNFTVTARDAFGNTAIGYTGTVHFTSSDGQAALPTDYTFTGVDAGVHTFSVTLNTPGNQTVTATDTTTGTITGNISTEVISAAATHFLVTAPATVTAGSSFSVTVTALNSANATDAGYRGTVHFTSTDGAAVLPANYTFTAADAGVHTFTVILTAAGAQTITATDTTTASITGNVSTTVNASVATHFSVSAPATATLGTAFTVTVTALDAFNNTAAGYRGTVHFTSSDGAAVLPPNYTFTAADAGVHSFTVTLNTAGTQSVTVTDTVTGSITGSTNITVNTSPPPPPPPATSKPFAVGTSRGVVGTVTMYKPNGTFDFSTQPFGPNYMNGVRVAVGDVTGDGIPDIVAATNGGVRAKVRVVDGSTHAVLSNNLLGNTQYTGKVSVAVGDVNGDGTADIAVGLNVGGPVARIYRGGDFTKLIGVRAGPPTGFIGATSVGLGDMTGDGKADLVVSAVYDGGSRVRGYSGASLAPGLVPQSLFTRLTLGGPYVNGLFLAVGDVSGDGRADLVIGSVAGQKPNVKVFSGEALVENNTRTKIASFKPDGALAKTGVRVAARDVNGDGQLEVLTSSGGLVSAYRIGTLEKLYSFNSGGAIWVG